MPSDAYRDAARRDEHEAARAQAARVHVGRPARATRSIGTPNLLEYDQGFFVKGGDGLADVKPIARPLQAAGLRARRRARAARGDRRPRADDRDVQPARRPRRSSTSATRTSGWTCCLGARRRVAAGELAPRRGLDADEVEAAYWEIDRRREATAYLHAPAVVVDADGLTCAASRASSGRRRAGRSTRRRCGGWRARCATAGPTGTGSRSTTAPASSPPAWRSSTSPAAGSRSRPSPAAALLVYNGEVYNHPELRAELEARGDASRPRCDTEVVLRLLERDGLGALDRLNGQFAFAWWQPARAPADPRPRPLRRAPAALRARSPTGRSSSPRRPRRCSRRARSTPRPTSPGSTTSSRSGARAPPRHAVPRRAASCRPGGLLVWERGRIVAERRWWEPELRAARATPTPSDLERADARQRAPAPARRRPGRHLPLRRPRLEPDHRAGARARRRPAAHLLGRLRRPALRRARPPGGGRRARSAPSTTSSRSARARSPARFPDVVAHAETPLIRTAPVPLYLLAREMREQRHHRRRHRRGRRRALLGLRPLQGGRRCASSARSDPSALGRCSTSSTPTSARPGRARGPAWPRVPPRGRRRRRPALLAPDARRGDRGGQGASTAPRSPRSSAPTPRSSGCARSCPQASALERARARRVPRGHARCSSPTCSPRRATASRWPTASRAATRSSTTASSSTPSALRPRRKLDGMRDKVALRELAATLLPEGIADSGRSSRTARPRSRRSSPAARPSGSRAAVGRRARARQGSSTRQRVAGPGPPLPGRPRHGSARGHGAGRRPVHAALAPAPSAPSGAV